MNALYVTNNGYGMVGRKPNIFVSNECLRNLINSSTFRKEFLKLYGANLLFVAPIGDKVSNNLYKVNLADMIKTRNEYNENEGWGYVGKLSAIK